MIIDRVRVINVIIIFISKLVLRVVLFQ